MPNHSKRTEAVAAAEIRGPREGAKGGPTDLVLTICTIPHPIISTINLHPRTSEMQPISVM